MPVFIKFPVSSMRTTIDFCLSTSSHENLRSNVIFFYSITASFQQYQVNGKKHLKQEQQADSQEKTYRMCFDIQERQKIYSLPFLVTKEIKLSIFQYKFIHNILYTNCILYKMKKVQDPHCPFCTDVTDQTVGHLFVSCPIASSFWSDFINWYHSVSKKTLRLSKNEIIYGILTNWSSCSTLNHLILIDKYTSSIANH